MNISEVAGGHVRGAGASLALGAFLFALGACDMPTRPPEWETTWVIPADSMILEVTELLPDAVTESDDKVTFVLSLDETSVEEPLRDLCATCEALHGQVAPKPAFTDGLVASIELPEDVFSARVIAGELQVRLINDFNFDPIRPGVGVTGTIELHVVTGADTLVSAVLDGATDSLPAFETREVTLQIRDAVIADSVHVEVAIYSPEGDPILIDAELPMRVEVLPGEIVLEDAQVRLEGKEVEMDPVDLDLEDLDEKISERVHEGAFRLEIHNPFDAEGRFTLVLTGGSWPISKVVDVTTGETRLRVELTGEELRALLGRSGVVMSAAGTVSAPSGAMTVKPATRLVAKSSIEIVAGSKVEE